MKGKKSKVSKSVQPTSVYTTTTGYELRLRGLSPLELERVRVGLEQPKVPVYIAEGAAGPIELPHNETTLTTDEDRAAWANYQAALTRQSMVAQERLLKLIIVKGLELDIEQEDWDAWVDEQTFIGFPLPTSPAERHYTFVTSAVINTAADLSEVIQRVMSLSGMTEEVMAEAQQLFRGAVEEATAQ